MSRVGQVFLFDHTVVLVVGKLTFPRKAGSSTPSTSKQVADLPTYTLLLIHDSGDTTWPVERWEASLDRWEALGRLL